ncbi:tripartite tricarboxylate transporter substrate binding protein [Azospirillum doebereinerae]|uniref:Tripartite tricarboxylate transporter substrate binding protein n=2 Tax=Azospirillum doebereinerae TaxID=92933 RepID=A0A433J1J5_9PROT|nr:tripartite tricarboxylate transporter substrate binding protein [Azospirillum doebereinerae]
MRRLWVRAVGLSMAALSMAGLATLAAGTAQAAYPDRPVRIVVPFSAGGGQDIFIRVIANKVSEQLGQPLVIDNRPGASGNIGASTVAAAAPDGYTVLLGTAATHGMNQALFKKLDFDAIKSFEPVALVAVVPLVLVTHPSVPAKTTPELVAYLKANPGTFNYGSSGTGAPLHLAGELFKKSARVDVVHVPYKGSAPAIADLLAGRTILQFDTFAATNQHVAAGSLNRLAVAGPSRSHGAPDVPTLLEQGIPGVDAYSTSAIFLPAGTPPAIVDRLNAVFRAAVSDPSLAGKLAEIGFDPVTDSTPASLKAHVEAEIAKWARIVADSGIQAE